MISTPQLIFITSLVFFFVNRATSADNNSSNAPYEHYSDGPSGENAEVEILNTRLGELNTKLGEVNGEHLKFCKLELTSAFPKTKPLKNLLHAFLHINTADFLVTKTYSQAAYEYFLELLSTVQDLNQPPLENPQAYCGNYHREQVEYCLHGISLIGCPPNVVGVVCLKNLYLYWKKDESIVYTTPLYGTANISDEELAIAISRGTNKYPDLSDRRLLKRLSDAYVLEEFYNKYPDQRRQLKECQRRRDNSIFQLQQALVEQSRQPCFENDADLNLAQNEYDYALTQYTNTSLSDLRLEYKRRQNIHTELGDLYAMYLYSQLKLFGRNMKLDSKETNIFKNPEDFCTTFLSNNPDYYNYLND